MIGDDHGVVEKLREHNRLRLKAEEAKTRANQRIRKLNETIRALGAVTINAADRGIVDRLEALAEQESSRADTIIRQFTALEAEIINDMARLLAESLRREEETRNHLAAIQQSLGELSGKLGAASDHLTGQEERPDGVAQAMRYLIGVVNPVHKVMADNSAALREVRASVESSRRAGEGQADLLRALTRMSDNRSARSLPPPSAWPAGSRMPRRGCSLFGSTARSRPAGRCRPPSCRRSAPFAPTAIRTRTTRRCSIGRTSTRPRLGWCAVRERPRDA